MAIWKILPVNGKIAWRYQCILTSFWLITASGFLCANISWKPQWQITATKKMESRLEYSCRLHDHKAGKLVSEIALEQNVLIMAVHWLKCHFHLIKNIAHFHNIIMNSSLAQNKMKLKHWDGWLMAPNLALDCDHILIIVKKEKNPTHIFFYFTLDCYQQIWPGRMIIWVHEVPFLCGVC